MHSDLTTHLAELRSLGGGRVWSLLVSLFGDLAQGDGDRIDGPVLSEIMARLDVKPEAARVALHRLRNDGWITSEKRGRISQHRLTAQGREISIAASDRIYAPPASGPQDWQLVLLDAADSEAQEITSAAGLTQLLPRVFVGAPTGPLPEDSLVLPGTDAPDWLCDQILPQAVQEDYARLHAVLAPLDKALGGNDSLAPVDAAVLRCLIVHNWRRLLLRHTTPSAALVAKRSPYHQCHVVVAGLLARVPRPPLNTLNTGRERPTGDQR